MARMLTKCGFYLFNSILVFAQSYTATTVAGMSRLLDGNAANTVPLRAPWGVAQDAAGNIYIADKFDNRIRKVGTDGRISTIAGTGVAGFSGDGGQATMAKLDTPRGLHVDGKGNLFIADYNNQRVRKLALPTGVITTVAGNGTLMASGDNGSALEAGMDPYDVTVDSAGNLYIADLLNSRIRKVDAATGKITTIAGTGIPGYGGDNGPANIAAIDSPNCIAVDLQGAVYFGDIANNVVRRIDPKTGIINAFAGTSNFGYADSRLDGDNGLATQALLILPIGLAVEPTGNVILITVYEFWRITVADGKIHVINIDADIGFSGDGNVLANAVFGFVEYVSVADNGDILLSDTGNFRVRRVHSGILNTVAGTAILDGIPATQAFLNAPAAAIPDGKGGFLIVDTADNRIRDVAPSGMISNVIGTGSYGSDRGRLAYPRGVVLDAHGNFLIADTNNDRIVRYVPGGNTSVYAGGNGRGFAGDNSFAIRSRLNAPLGVALDAAGNLYIADSGNFRVRMVDTNGNITTLAGTGAQGSSGDNGPANLAKVMPADVAVDGGGNLYIADAANHRIRKVDLSTKIITTVAGIGTPGLTGDGGPATAAQLKIPFGVAVDAAGALYIADAGNSVLRRVKGGVISTIAGTGGIDFTVESGTATGVAMDVAHVAVDTDGSIYITDQTNDRIRKLTVQIPMTLKLQSGDGQSGPPGKLLAVAAKVADANGLPVGQVTVTFAVTSGTATIAAPAVQTGGDGVATALVTLGGSVGPVKISASAAGLGSVTFTLTITPPPVPMPTIGDGGVEGAALSQPPVVALSVDGIASVFGSNFGAGGTFQKVGPGDLVNGAVPTNFKNICVETGGTRAPVFGASDTQVNFQTPAIPSGGTISVRVIAGCGTANELPSNTVSIAAQPASPEFFYFAHNTNGANPVAATDSLTFLGIAPADLFPGSGFVPAQPKEYVTVYFTGGGATNPQVAPGAFPTVSATVAGDSHVFLNGRELPAANILYCGFTPQSPGLYQLNLLLPDDTPDGNLSLTIRIAGVASPAGAFLAVHRQQ
jgi:uncharacterized protein (TIGR03437 family)